MFDLDQILNLFFDNIKKVFFPEEWINLDLKFSKSELFTLLLLEKRKEITMTELAEYINSPMSTTTGIVDRLVKNGFIERGRSDFDRRIVVLKLKEKGSELLNHFKETINMYFVKAMKNLTDEEKKFMINIVLKMMHNLQESTNQDLTMEQNNSELKKINIE